MNTETAKQIEASFLEFFEKTQRALEIKTEDDYQFALDLLEYVMNKAEDREGEPRLHLINLLFDTIEEYESNLESTQLFDKEIEAMDPHASMLRVLIDQYDLDIKPGAAGGILKHIQGKSSMTDEESLLNGIQKSSETGSWPSLILSLRKNWINSISPGAIEKVKSIFEDEDSAVKWLTEENRALGRIPIELISEGREQEVLDVLGRIEWGVFS
ncbi:MbcA/ParS/Xre antitoxin family protein [Pelobacter seleniigenes]|uniref:MbcA/ParS/Xre antitoxin family protein n=1 Tax=Pelobacter seleniigenes TaxID=407188 RepID=UPI0012B992D3|nr:MbcA/ParS/Xre antitoxin family protein [Pelobacter seleniigenes]